MTYDWRKSLDPPPKCIFSFIQKGRNLLPRRDLISKVSLRERSPEKFTCLKGILMRTHLVATFVQLDALNRVLAEVAERQRPQPQSQPHEPHFPPNIPRDPCQRRRISCNSLSSMELSDIFPYRRDLAYGFPPPGAVTEFEASTSCSHLEILQHRNGSEIETSCNEGPLDDTNFSAWLSKVGLLI